MKTKTLILLLLIAFCTSSCKKTYNKVFKTKIDVTVTDGNTGLPVKNARVYISGYNKPKDKIITEPAVAFVYYNGLTDEYGKLYYEFKADLKSSYYYTYFCRIMIFFPDSSTYTQIKSNFVMNYDKSNVKLGHKNSYISTFY